MPPWREALGAHNVIAPDQQTSWRDLGKENSFYRKMLNQPRVWGLLGGTAFLGATFAAGLLGRGYCRPSAAQVTV